MKKLCYLYLINYADEKPDLAILAVQNFIKDAADQDALIRALSVRTMGCIHSDKIAEYLTEPLRVCLSDTDPYVRKTAAMCVCKLYDIAPEMVEEQGFIDILHDMISDENPTVVANAIAALCEISDNSPTEILKIDTSVLQKLLVALQECTEWGQCYILDCLVRYEPRDDREAEQIIERIQSRLQHNNTAVVLCAIKVIMVYLEFISRQDVIRSLVRKMAPPLVTLLSNEHPEIQYVSLRNINLIVQKRAEILANEIRVFFCKYNDPIYVKIEKMDIMVKLATDRNIDQVLSEFKGYAQEVDVDIVRKAVRCIGKCAIRLQKSSEKCVKALLNLIQEKVNYVVQEAIIVIRDIFRRYPNKYESIIGILCQNLDTLDEPEAKAAMIWIIGEYVMMLISHL